MTVVVLYLYLFIVVIEIALFDGIILQNCVSSNRRTCDGQLIQDCFLFLIRNMVRFPIFSDVVILILVTFYSFKILFFIDIYLLLNIFWVLSLSKKDFASIFIYWYWCSNKESYWVLYVYVMFSTSAKSFPNFVFENFISWIFYPLNRIILSLSLLMLVT